MSEYDGLDTYNEETEHDMWVDFDNYENTGLGKAPRLPKSGVYSFSLYSYIKTDISYYP